MSERIVMVKLKVEGERLHLCKCMLQRMTAPGGRGGLEVKAKTAKQWDIQGSPPRQ